MRTSKHLFILGEISSLNIKKDSSLLLANALMNKGAQVYLLEESKFYITPGLEKISLRANPFEAKLFKDKYYMENFEFGAPELVELDEEWTIHMRSDPPVDQRYMRCLWMLDYLAQRGIRVTNNPRAVMTTNEKLAPYTYKTPSVLSYYGEDGEGLEHFLSELESDEIIVKPIDSFSGIGVEKLALRALGVQKCRESISKRKEAVIVQPFIEQVYQGEDRSLYLGAKLIGAITKYPQNESYLANIAQGALFEKCELSAEVEKYCQEIADELLEIGIDFVAFDILDGMISEVNVTCPGLVNEVSTALGENLAIKYADYFMQ